MKLALGRLGSAGTRTLIQRAIASLRARGTDAHLWLPGGDVRTYGPELAPALEAGAWGTVDAGITVSGGVASVNTTGLGVYLRQPNVLTVGKTYQVSITGANTSGSTQGLYYGWSPSLAIPSGGTATVTGTLVATQTTLFVYFYSNTVGTITNLSVREITSITPTITNGLTTGNYLESTGNTVATVDNPTGLVLDALGTVGVELVDTANTAATWTAYGSNTVTQNGAWVDITYVNNAIGAYLPLTSTGGLSSNFDPAKTYLITGMARINTGSATVYCYTGSANITGPTITSPTGEPFRLVLSGLSATEATIAINNNLSAGEVFGYSNISVREVSGIHLMQGTTQNKPVLRRGLTNLLTYSSDFSNAAWTKNNITVSGTNTLIPAATSTEHYLDDSVATAFVTGSSYTKAVSAKPSGYRWLRLAFPNGPFAASGRAAWFDLQTGVVGTVQSGVTATIAASGDQYVCSIYGTAVGTSTVKTFTSIANSDGGSLTFTGDGTSGIFVGLALITPGSYTASQILAAGGIPVTTTAAASNPDAGKYSWSFDGSNDSLLTGNLGITNACTIVIAGRLDSLPTASFLFAEAANGARVGVASTGLIDFNKNGGASVVTSSTGAVVAGVPFVITARLQNGTGVIRMNGVQIATAASALTFSATTGAYIGANFAGSAYLCNGSLGNVLAMPLALTDAECLLVERMAASQFPNGPVF